MSGMTRVSVLRLPLIASVGGKGAPPSRLRDVGKVMMPLLSFVIWPGLPRPPVAVTSACSRNNAPRVVDLSHQGPGLTSLVSRSPRAFDSWRGHCQDPRTLGSRMDRLPSNEVRQAADLPVRCPFLPT